MKLPFKKPSSKKLKVTQHAEMNCSFPHYQVVDGWLRLEALHFVSYFSHNFLSNTGFNSLEIGVHHGRFFIGIENLTPKERDSIAIDVFENQSINIDKSGKGDLEMFCKNVERFCVNPTRVKPKKMDSLDIVPALLGEQSYGIISIDGGHTARHTVSDLSNAARLMMDRGIVVLDDIFNQDWLGVISGACDYFSSKNSGRLVPFAIGFNKLFCCHFSYSERIISHIMNEKEALSKINVLPFKVTNFCDHPVVSLRPTDHG